MVRLSCWRGSGREARLLLLVVERWGSLIGDRLLTGYEFWAFVSRVLCLQTAVVPQISVILYSYVFFQMKRQNSMNEMRFWSSLESVLTWA